MFKIKLKNNKKKKKLPHFLFAMLLIQKIHVDFIGTFGHFIKVFCHESLHRILLLSKH